MPAALELTGRTFGRLVVVRRSHKDGTGAWVWLCRCDCARYVFVRGATLAAGRTSACSRCAAAMRSRTHGETGTPLYRRWRAMLDRCENRHHRGWQNYGGRGIAVCTRWHSYEAFAADMGPTFRPDLELDRIDTDGDYEPRNCRWISHADQQSNKRNNHVVEWRGHVKTVTQWGSILGISSNTLVHRCARGACGGRRRRRGLENQIHEA